MPRFPISFQGPIDIINEKLLAIFLKKKKTFAKLETEN